MSIDGLAGIQANQKSRPGAPAQKFNPYKFFSGVGTGVLNPKQMREYARSATALEIRPQLRGYKQLGKQIAKTNAKEQAGFGKLGERLQGGVTDVYRNIAESEAQNMANQQALAGQLGQKSAAIANEGSQALNALGNNQTGAQQAALQLRGAPTSPTQANPAQTELAQAVAAQKTAQITNSGAAQQFALQQGANNTSFASQIGAASQLQGGAAQSEIAHQIQTRDAASNQKSQLAQQEALGKLAEVKALKGATFVKNLQGIRESEQKFKLGEQAVAGKKNEQKLAEQEAGTAKQQANRAYNLELKKFGLSQWEAHHPSATSSELAKAKKAYASEVGEVKGIIPQLVAEAKAAEKGGEKGIADNFGAYLAGANKNTSAKSQVVRKVLKHWWTKGGQDVNGPSLGR